MSLKHVEGRLVVKIDLNYKNSHTFEDGTKIELARKYDNFNQRYTQPVNAWVESAENIPSGSEVIVHHNCVHETNRILNYKPLSGSVEGSDIRYFSIQENEAFAWRSGDQWLPLPGFDFALRIFKPYEGVLDGIEPTQVKDVLWMTTGEYKDKACITLRHSDYEMIFQDINGREGNIIRIRTSDNPVDQRESEVVAIHDELTEKVLAGKLLVGLNKSNAKPIKEHQYVG